MENQLAAQAWGAMIHLWCFNLDWTFVLCCDLLGMKQGSLSKEKCRMFYSLTVG